MTKIYLLTNVVIVSAIIVICAIPRCDGVISDKRLCYDPKCSEPISLARTSVRYNSIEPPILSFPPNIEITIYSKEAGSRLDLWGATVHGKRGYVPKSLVRETKKLQSKLTHEVPTEFVQKEINTTDKSKVNVPSKAKIPESTGNVNVKEIKTADKSQNSNDIKKVKAEVDGNKNKLETSQDSETAKPQTRGDDPAPAVEPSDPHAKESVQYNAEKILEDVQSITPSYEVIDGTTIPLLDEEALRIKPSFATPVIAATVNPNEEPILSVHPSLPSNIRPFISRFSNSDSPAIVEDHLQSEANVFAENQTGENDSGRQSLPATKDVHDAKSNESNVSEENNVANDSRIEDLSNESHSGEIGTLENSQSGEYSKDNTQTVINSLENDENKKPESSDESVNGSIDISSSEKELPQADDARGNFGRDTQSNEVDVGENIADNLEGENVTSNSPPFPETVEVSDTINQDKSDEGSTQTDSNNNALHEEAPKFDNDSSEVLQNESELEGTIPEQEFHDSTEQTEYLSDDNITDTSKEVDGPDNVGDKTVINEAEVPLSSQSVEQHDNQVIESDGVSDDNKIFNIGNVDEVGVETGIENSSREESVENDYQLDESNPGSEELITEQYPNSAEEQLTTSRSLLMVEEGLLDNDKQSNINSLDINEPGSSETQSSQEPENYTYNEADVSTEVPEFVNVEQSAESISITKVLHNEVAPPEVCHISSDCADLDNARTFSNQKENIEDQDEGLFSSVFEHHNYLETLLYLSLTAFTTLLFSLGYYYIENQRRDKELVAKINMLEKELLVTTKESMMLNDDLKATKHKLNSIEDESFGSNEMVLSLKSELEAAQITKGELEDQIVTLEKELESATEAGLELERMLREFLASQSDENPLAQSVEDLQTRLNAQQAANESLTNNLNLKSQENEALTSELAFTQERCQQLEVEVTRLSGELKIQSNLKNSAENDFSAKIAQLNKQINKLSEERAGLITQLTAKEMALNDFSEVMKQQSADSLDLEKLYDVSHIKAEALLVTNERDELKIKLTEVEGAHQLLEEHMKLIKEEIASVTEQYEVAERDKTEAQTRLEVLSNYFKEKESQLQKELGMQEAMWVQKQGEVTSTVDRIQTMQNEIQNYRQQIETLKREILDQEREYKSQIGALEIKSHEQWVIARQSERRLEESKAEASQLRNRLTMVEKSINEVDPDTKLHRLETNGETVSSPQLFMGAETSSSPIIFTGSSGVPPLPPSYIYGAPLPPPFIPPPPHSGGGPMYDISRRPPPLGGRLSSPPPIPLHHPSGRYEDANSPPPPLSPPLHPSYNHRSPPPPFSNERTHPHPPPPFLPPLGTSHSWGDEPLPPLRIHPNQREQRVRNHKGSLHSSGDSLDKTNHTGKS